MRDVDLRKAFGTTPESAKLRVRLALASETSKKEKIMKKKISTLLAAALVVAVLCGTALAAGSGLLDRFSYKDGEDHLENTYLARGVQAIGQVYDGQALKFELADSLYDAEGGSLALGWTLEKKNAEDEIYLLLDEISAIDGLGRLSNFAYMTECFLPDEIASGFASISLDSPIDGECRLSFKALRAKSALVAVAESDDWEAFKAEVARVIAEGNIPVAGDGYIEISVKDGQSYSEALVESGLFELTDEFTVAFTPDAALLANDKREYEGEKLFEFDGYAVRILSATLTPLTCEVKFDYICDESPTDEWSFSLEADGASIWCAAQNGTIGEPKLEDGKWVCEVTLTADTPFTRPDALTLKLTTFDADLNATVYDGDAVTLNFD